jgi:Flp pilus assembly protein TadD
LGTELVKFGRFDDAMTEYQTAARLDPAKPQPFYLMGKAWLRHGQSGAAVTAFQKALSVDANDCPSLVYLARVLASDLSPQNRDGPRAVSLAEQANRLTGGNQPFILGTLAMAYAEAGRFEDARKTARTALTLAADGDGKTIADLRGQLQLYEADQPFRKAFTIPPAAGHP